MSKTLPKAWECPQCGAGLDVCGKGKCREPWRNCVGLACSSAKHEHHFRDTVDEPVCDAARCGHCGWRADGAEGMP